MLGQNESNRKSEPSDDPVGSIVKIEATKKAGVGNYVGIGVGLFMLCFLFIPELVKGNLQSIYYLGAAFWIGIIIYCSFNIYNARTIRAS